MRLLPDVTCPACGLTDCVLASDDQRTCEECGAWWEEDEIITEDDDVD
jgi:hypothetical protein